MRRANPGNSSLHVRAAREFLRALRGRRSQRAFARRLGYRANPITDWEHGRRFPTGEEAMRAAHLVGIDVEGAFSRFHPAPPPARDEGRYRLAAWLDVLRGSTPAVHLAARTGVSPFAVGRWLRGDARPRLPDLFALVDAATGRLPDLVAALVPIASVPSLQARHAAAEAARRAAYDAPWTEAVLRVLESPAYRALERHTTGWIAARLSIPAEDERHSLALLRRAGVVRRRKRSYEVVDEASVDTRGERERVTVLLRHWSEVARARAAARGGDDYFAYNVFTLPAGDVDKVRELLRRTFREIRSLAAAAPPQDRVMLLNLQLLELSARER